MTETEQLEQQRHESPLYSERGTTRIADTVISQIIEQAVDGVEGIRPGRTSSKIGRYEVAVDFRMEMEYGRDLPELTSELRHRIREHVEGMTGLRVKEQNIIVTDIFFPDQEETVRQEQTRSRVK